MSNQLPPSPSRRSVLGALGVAMAAQACATAEQTPPATPMAMPHHDMTPPMPAGGRPKIAMLVYPNMVMMDLAGPQTTLFIAGCEIALVGKDRTPVSTDIGIPVTPTATIADYTEKADVLFIPGGIMGTTACMNDPAVLDFVARTGAAAKWVTSVCTGSLLLGAAGLLRGYTATSHWAVRDLLPIMGATVSTDRVATDRNRMTGGGVTAGIDFGLTLVEQLIDRPTAERVQLMIEYAPAPPINVGTPELAGPERTAAMRARRATMDDAARSAAEAAARRLGI